MAMSLTDAAERILREHSPGAPMHYRRITELAIEEELVAPGGATPEASMNASVNTEIRRRQAAGKAPKFRSHGGGLYGLAIPTDPLGGGVERHNQDVRDRLRELLGEMDPKEFEKLIGVLLTSIGFDEVEVTQYHGDKGVDLRAVLTVGGITDVRTAIQVKRWANNVRAPQVRELRGGLGPHERGLIISTSNFSAGAQDEADEPDRSPISLVGGDDLLDLLIDNEIGVTAKSVQILELDEASLSDLDDEVGANGRSVVTGQARSIWPLPGGGEAMKTTLDQMLRFVVASAPSVQSAIEWMLENFESVESGKSARSYWNVPRAFGLTAMDGEQLSLTSAGVAYLGEPTDAALFEAIRENVLGIDEIMSCLDEGPATTEQLLAVLRERAGVEWETDAQVGWRMRWLALVGGVASGDDGWYLTDDHS